MSRAGDDDDDAFGDDRTQVTPWPTPDNQASPFPSNPGSPPAPPQRNTPMPQLPQRPTPQPPQRPTPQPPQRPTPVPPQNPQWPAPPAQQPSGGWQAGAPSQEEPYQQPYPQQVPPQPAASAATPPDARLSALRSLSINKDGGPQYVAKPASTPGSSRKLATVLPWTLLGIVVGVVLINQFVVPIWSKSERSAPQGAAPTTEVVTPVTSGGQALHAAGYIAPNTPIVVGSAVPGRVKALLVNEGQKVKKNQVVAQLDDGHARADLSLAAATLRDAERRLNRTRTLRKVEAATAADLDQALGSVEISRAALAPIRQRIEDAKIRSPIDGTVMEELVQPGSMVVGNAGIVKLADLTKLVAEIDVNEADLATIRIDQKAEVTSDAFADTTFSGVVREIAEQADRSKGTVTVKVYLQVAENTLRPGMSVKVTFEVTEAKSRLLIPKTAVTPSGMVSVIGDDGAVTARQLKTVSAGPNKVEVLEGLKAGERIMLVPSASGTAPPPRP